MSLTQSFFEQLDYLAETYQYTFELFGNFIELLGVIFIFCTLRHSIKQSKTKVNGFIYLDSIYFSGSSEKDKVRVTLTNLSNHTIRFRRILLWRLRIFDKYFHDSYIFIALDKMPNLDMKDLTITIGPYEEMAGSLDMIIDCRKEIKTSCTLDKKKIPRWLRFLCGQKPRFPETFVSREWCSVDEIMDLQPKLPHFMRRFLVAPYILVNDQYFKCKLSHECKKILFDKNTD